MKQAHLLRRDQHWYDSRPTTYTLGTKGEDLLATHEKEIEQENQRHAEAIAEKGRQDHQTKKGMYIQVIIAIVSALAAVLFQKYLG